MRRQRNENLEGGEKKKERIKRQNKTTSIGYSLGKERGTVFTERSAKFMLEVANHTDRGDVQRALKRARNGKHE